jgi:hypothetical protein
MLIKSVHSESDRNRYNSTYTEDTYNDHAMHPVTTLEPAMFLEKNPALFSNSIRFSGGPSTSSTLQNRNTATTIAESPLSSPAIGHSFSTDAYAMMSTPIDRSATPRISSSVITTPTDFNGIMNDSRSSYWSSSDK